MAAGNAAYGSLKEVRPESGLEAASPLATNSRIPVVAPLRIFLAHHVAAVCLPRLTPINFPWGLCGRARSSAARRGAFGARMGGDNR